MPFTKKNYLLMFAGLGAILLGFIIMSSDSEQHGFGFMGLTLGPLIVFLGFVIELFAILYNPDKNNK